MVEGTTAIDVTPRARVMAEVLAELVDLAVGKTTLELVFEDGHLLTVYRKEKISANALGRFDRPS